MTPNQELLKDSVEFRWSDKCENVFKTAKETVASDMALSHYYLEEEIKLSCNELQYRIGAVLAQVNY